MDLSEKQEKAIEGLTIHIADRVLQEIADRMPIVETKNGITLRDQFAMLALISLYISRPEQIIKYTISAVCKKAFNIADEMMEIRKPKVEMAIVPKTHRHIHIELHNSLDILVADFIGHTEKLPSKSTIYDLIEWSYEQTINPTEEK